MNPKTEASFAGVQFAGVGLFSARPVRVAIAIGESGGIRFLRAGGQAPVHAMIGSVIGAHGPLGGRNTVLKGGRASIATVEHLLSALAGLGIWNADVHIDADELPILDGSAAGFVEELSRLPHAREKGKTISLENVVRAEDARTGAWIEARPSSGIHYRYELSYPPGDGIGNQSFEWNGSAGTYAKEIAPARTYSLEREALAMKAAGLFPHLTARDMLVIAPSGEAIENTLRFPDEPARHKLLDLIGDLALLGGPLRAEVVAHKSSHALTHELCRRIVAATA